MTKQEALKEMKKGKKISHFLFSPEEWMTIEGNKIKLEDGVICSQSEFWKWRTDENWNDGYQFWG